jgi:hypothetical protein
MSTRHFIVFPLLALALGGCDQLGIETPAQATARIEADGRAVGGACRHAGRALETCYEMNRRVPKAAVYAGWRDMDAYMRENGIAVVAPEGELATPENKGHVEPGDTATAPAPEAGTATKPSEAAEAKPAEKAVPKPEAKPTAKSAAAPQAIHPLA